MPTEILYLLILLAVIAGVLILLKRPIYEAMFIGYIVMIFVTGSQNLLVPLLIKPSTNTLFYAIFAFLTLAHIFGETRVVDDIINFVLALVGRLRGGAGYVSLIGSTFMASLSGTGPGNVAATGVFTIPAMIKTGFPKALASTVEMSASSLGPMIPPSGTILLAFGALDILYPDTYDLSKFWLLVWVIGLYFILQRVLTLYMFCKYYDVKPMDAADIPSLSSTLRQGWKALLVPLLIFIPLFLDFQFRDTFFVSRLGESGASAFGSSIILFTPGLAAVYAILISRKRIEGGINLQYLFNSLKNAIKTVTPVAITVYFAYSISYLFGELNIGGALGEFITGLGMVRWQLAIFIPVFTTFLGMILPGSSQIAIFGTGIVGGMAALGVNPLLAAAMLPAITGALEGMTPPLALSMYAAMGISGSGFRETSKLAFIWVGVHLLFAILIMAGILPVMFT